MNLFAGKPSSFPSLGAPLTFFLYPQDGHNFFKASIHLTSLVLLFNICIAAIFVVSGNCVKKIEHVQPYLGARGNAIVRRISYVAVYCNLLTNVKLTCLK